MEKIWMTSEGNGRENAQNDEIIINTIYRNSHRTSSMEKGVLRNFAKFTGKRLYQSLFLPATLLKKRLWYRRFPVNFAKFLRTPFLQNTSGRLLLHLHETRFSCN